ncbi:MAG: sodium/proton-translocating pyrophosphatase [Planctomycetota bacterium]
MPEVVRQRTDALDSLGNTTAATGKGFAIGSAALTALALLAAYVEGVRVGFDRWGDSFVEELAADDARGPGIYKLSNQFVVDVVQDEAGEASAVGYLLMPTDLRRGAFPADWPGVGLGDPLPAGSQAFFTRGSDGVLGFADSSEAPLPVREATLPQFNVYYDATLMNPKVLVGVFLGAMATFAFCAMTMKAVGRAAQGMVEEVRRQFREKPGIMDGSETPDYAAPVAISTVSAQREMFGPSVLGLVLPVAVGLTLGVAGVLGLLMGTLTCGFCLAVFMANSGGSWDNAKKYIEAGAHGGKGTEAHKAAVVGDTVGDPFKDTSGPSLNILIKLMSIVSVVIAGLVVRYSFDSLGIF